ncbi:hypothetical protein HYPSUDRAFT_39809 [Hypholoma sublateritium FD-334 SS-4]|uniref:Protein kinase domain-containing protein n=1 Tax=Hypholoma sublateritium (strain FD-334 SS-4) TaxID=945553 RepID=A0A0D2P4M1_HYPSF|nr:hypothetical protein HYPSUDRAFT_39809 [Hypholoma sublateritium FD-334 SS-4]
MALVKIIQRLGLLFSSSSLSLFRRLHFTLVRLFMFPARGWLPAGLHMWRGLHFDESDSEAYTRTWNSLRPLFELHSFTLWAQSDELNQFMYDPPALSHYASVPADRQYEFVLRQFSPGNGLFHAVRRCKQDYVVRVMSVSGEDLHHLRLMRLLSNNHILPMVSEIVYEDIVPGVFPRLGEGLITALIPEAGRSIEDSIYMVTQALEAVVYIHGKNIAHRDLFLDNFMVEWNPHSLSSQNWTRPRVYLIDFETAVQFSDDIDSSNRLCSVFPLSLAPEDYARPRAPELRVLVPEPSMYCPFLLPVDTWQFGFHLVQMLSETGIEDIDTLWLSMMPDNPIDRVTAAEVLQKLSEFLAGVPPRILKRTYTCSPIYM